MSINFPKRARREDPHGHMVVQEMLDYMRNAVNKSSGSGGTGSSGQLGQPYANTIPTISASGGGASLGNAANLIAKRSVWGKTCHYYGRFTLGSTTTFGVGELYLNLDVPALGSGIPSHIGTGWVYDVSAGAMLQTSAQVVSGNQVRFLGPTSTPFGGSQVVSGSVPFPMSWAVGDEFSWHILYEAA